MSPRFCYRTAAVLLVLFALGHQFGFRQVDPAWQADAVVASMQSVHFNVQGFNRSYWDFFSGFGFFSTAFLLFSAVLAFEMSRLDANTLRQLVRARQAFALCYVAIAALMWTNFFTTPLVFAVLVAIALVVPAFSRSS